MRTKKITNYIKGLFSQNLGLKLFAFIFAFGMWIMVMNTLNPAEVRTFNVKLIVNGADSLKESDLICTNLDDLSNQTIAIKIKATRPDLTELNSAKEKITAMIDLSKFAALTEDELNEAVYAAVIPNLSIYSNAYEIVGYSPSSIGVNIDKLVEFEVPVRIEEENEPEGSKIECRAAAETVRVKGPESMKEQAGYAGLTVDLTAIAEAGIISVKPILYNEDGEPIKNDFFEILTEYVEVASEVFKYGNVKIEVPDIIGQPAVGYGIVGSVITEPAEIVVLGKEDNLRTESIKLPAITLNGESSDYSETVSVEELLTERGLTAADKSKTEIKVTVKIEKAEPVKMTVAGSDISIEGLAEGYELASEIGDTDVYVLGIEEDLKDVKPKGHIDLSGCAAGINKAELQLEGLTLAEKAEVEVEIISKEQETASYVEEEEDIEGNPE